MSHAPIESELILKRCAAERKSLALWLKKENGEWDQQRTELIERWENGSWFYRLMFSHPDKPQSSFNDFQPKLNKMTYDDAIDRVRDLEALANKSVDGIVMLSKSDARFLNIDNDGT